MKKSLLGRASLVSLVLFTLMPAVLVSLGCASRIPQTLGVAPRVDSPRFDIDKIQFWTMDRGDQRQPFSLREAMDLEGVDHLLLTFGSKACTACNLKAEALKRQVLGKHPIFLTPEGLRFGVIGVNTDPNPERLGSYTKQYPFIRWSDPSGVTMVQHFLVGAETFKVPLTVLVSRQEILWRVGADDKTSVGEIMERVSLSLRGQNGEQTARPPQDPASFPAEAPIQDPAPYPEIDPAEGPNDSQAPVSLASRNARRFSGVVVEECSGDPKSLREHLLQEKTLKEKTLQSLWQTGKPLVIQVVRHSCQGDCLVSHEAIAAFCAGLPEPKKCQNLTLVATEEAVSGHDYGSLPAGTGVCQAPGILRGGEDFLKVFPSLFDGQYPRTLDPRGIVSIDRRERGPQVYVFAPSGQLLFAKEGFFGADELKKSLMAPLEVAAGNLGPLPPVGADFPLFTGVETIGLSTLRQRHRWTALGFFQTECGSCELEFKHWSAPGGLLDFCQERPGFCGVYGVENRYRLEDWSVEEFYGKLINGYQLGPYDRYAGFKGLGIRVPLLLDPTPDDVGADSFINRIHDGYLLAQSPQLGNGYRIVIYDEDGKIARILESKEPPQGGGKDELELFLEDQWNREKSGIGDQRR